MLLPYEEITEIMEVRMSFVNAVLSGNNQPEPEIGTPVTVCYYSDRNPAEIAEIVRFKSGAKKGQIRGVRLRAMNWKIVSGSEYDGSAVYEYTSNPIAPLSGLYLRNERGQYQAKGKGAKLSIGSAERYYDPHF